MYDAVAFVVKISIHAPVKGATDPSSCVEKLTE